jgi:uncharacterized protein YdiU (UPF0061 family)
MLRDSSYRQLPDKAFALVETQSSAAPTLLAWNNTLAVELGLDDLADSDEERARLFSGNGEFASSPIALAYAGHQFGQFVPQLGDGRAALVGEAVLPDGQRRDIQLKGSGRTPYSRGGDGRSALGPVIREYILSESMHALGVPTTRSLAAVATGEQVVRQGLEPGGVFARVASSHIRVGTFEYFAVRRDSDTLKQLADYAIHRHYPERADDTHPYLALFRGVAERQAELVAHWMSIGFIHGVMNTDNTSIAGETIDYGPCAFMDEFRHDKVFSSIDHFGRYAYRNQPAIAQWNLARFAETLLQLDDRRPGFEEALADFGAVYEAHYLERMRAKLGLATEDSQDAALIKDWLDALQEAGEDYTLSHRALAERYATGSPAELGDVEVRWRSRVAAEGQSAQVTRDSMHAVNPLFIPRNHRVEEAIDSAYQGDVAMFRKMLEVLANPFVDQPENAHYAEPPLPEERVTRTFCGT